MNSNAELEALWIGAWNELAELTAQHGTVYGTVLCQLPDGQLVDAEARSRIRCTAAGRSMYSPAG